MYVDGLLAENHGIDAGRVRPAALRGARAPPTRRTTSSRTGRRPTRCPTGGTHLAYLDVWQREVTHLEDPDLVEVAVGVDTTARWQTAWQVRLLPSADRHARARPTTTTSPAGST